MKIRPAQAADARSIAAVHAASWRRAYRDALDPKYLRGDILSERCGLWAHRLEKAPANQHVLVAEVEGRVMGFACAYAREDGQWGTLLDNIHVLRSARGRGVGSELMAAIGGWCLATSPSEGLFLWVLQSNRQAQHFYQVLGAVEAGTDLWSPPGGGAVPRYRYAWHRVQELLAKLSARSPRFAGRPL